MENVKNTDFNNNNAMLDSEKADQVIYVTPSVKDRIKRLMTKMDFRSANDFIVHIITPIEEKVFKKGDTS